MRKLMACAALALGLVLAGCQTVALPSLNLANAVTLNTIYGIENAYGVAVSASNAYKALPLCRTGTVPSATNICARRSVVVRLQAAMARARLAVNRMVTFAKTYPSVDLTNLVSAARAALIDVQDILAEGAQ